MPYTIDKLSGEPILYFYHETDDTTAETPIVLAALVDALDKLTEPVFVLMDIRKLTFGMENILNSASNATQGPGALLRHPNLRESVVVTSSSVVKLAAKGLNSPVFGNVKVHIFDTPEDALAYCRDAIAREGAGENRSANAG